MKELFFAESLAQAMRLGLSEFIDADDPPSRFRSRFIAPGEIVDPRSEIGYVEDYGYPHMYCCESDREISAKETRLLNLLSEYRAKGILPDEILTKFSGSLWSLVDDYLLDAIKDIFAEIEKRSES